MLCRYVLFLLSMYPVGYCFILYSMYFKFFVKPKRSQQAIKKEESKSS